MASSEFHWPAGKRGALSISFDDAVPDQLDKAIPILDRFGLRASFYVGLASFEKRIDDWRKSAQIGHEIGNHSVNHPCSGNFWWSKKAALEDYTVQQMENELDEASRRIESLASVKPKTFAYPCGMTFIGRGETRQSYVPLVARRFLAGRGFMGESANDPAFCDMACLVARGFDFTSFATIKSWIDDAMQRGEWLILAGHAIGDDKPYHVPLSVFESLCALCREREAEVWTDTIAKIGQYVVDARSAR